jgi:branched-subunit amino acid permease
MKRWIFGGIVGAGFACLNYGCYHSKIWAVAAFCLTGVIIPFFATIIIGNG